MLSGIEDQIVEFFFRDDASPPAVIKPQVLAQAVIAVRQYGGLSPIKMTDVFPSCGAYRALRLIRGVVIHLGKDVFVDLLLLSAQNRQERFALEPRRLLDCNEFADGRKDVEMRDQTVAHHASAELAGTAHD